MNPSSQWTRLELGLDLSSPISDVKKKEGWSLRDKTMFCCFWGNSECSFWGLNVSNATLSYLPNNASRDQRVMIRHQCNGVDEAPGQKAACGMVGKYDMDT